MVSGTVTFKELQEAWQGRHGCPEKLAKRYREGVSFLGNEDRNIFPDREPQVKVILYLENTVSA